MSTIVSGASGAWGTQDVTGDKAFELDQYGILNVSSEDKNGIRNGTKKVGTTTISSREDLNNEALSIDGVDFSMLKATKRENGSIDVYDQSMPPVRICNIFKDGESIKVQMQNGDGNPVVFNINASTANKQALTPNDVLQLLKNAPATTTPTTTTTSAATTSAATTPAPALTTNASDTNGVFNNDSTSQDYFLNHFDASGISTAGNIKVSADLINDEWGMDADSIKKLEKIYGDPTTRDKNPNYLDATALKAIDLDGNDKVDKNELQILTDQIDPSGTDSEAKKSVEDVKTAYTAATAFEQQAAKLNDKSSVKQQQRILDAYDAKTGDLTDSQKTIFDNALSNIMTGDEATTKEKHGYELLSQLLAGGVRTPSTATAGAPSISAPSMGSASPLDHLLAAQMQAALGATQASSYASYPPAMSDPLGLGSSQGMMSMPMSMPMASNPMMAGVPGMPSMMPSNPMGQMMGSVPFTLSGFINIGGGGGGNNGGGGSGWPF